MNPNHRRGLDAHQILEGALGGRMTREEAETLRRRFVDGYVLGAYIMVMMNAHCENCKGSFPVADNAKTCPVFCPPCGRAYAAKARAALEAGDRAAQRGMVSNDTRRHERFCRLHPDHDGPCHDERL